MATSLSGIKWSWLNGKKHEFALNKGFFQRETKIDISRFIEDGANTIVYYPAVCPLKIYVELVEKYEPKASPSFLDKIKDVEAEEEEDNGND